MEPDQKSNTTWEGYVLVDTKTQELARVKKQARCHYSLRLI